MAGMAIMAGMACLSFLCCDFIYSLAQEYAGPKLANFCSFAAFIMFWSLFLTIAVAKIIQD